MKLSLVSYNNHLTAITRKRVFVKVANQLQSDIILFPGHSLKDIDDAIEVASQLKKNHPLIILELENFGNTTLRIHNAIFSIKDKKLINHYTGQLFSSRDDIKGQEVLMAKFFDEIPRRSFNYDGKSFLIVQCGENSFLGNRQADSNKAYFSFENNERLNERFERMMADYDVLLNPIHTIQGNQGKMSKRREYLSKDGRYYFGTCSLDEKTEGNLKHKCLQYALRSGNELTTMDECSDGKYYIARTFEL